MNGLGFEEFDWNCILSVAGCSGSPCEAVNPKPHPRVSSFTFFPRSYSMGDCELIASVLSLFLSAPNCNFCIIKVFILNGLVFEEFDFCLSRGV